MEDRRSSAQEGRSSVKQDRCVQNYANASFLVGECLEIKRGKTELIHSREGIMGHGEISERKTTFPQGVLD